MSQLLKIGIVGLGKMGRIRAETIRDNEHTMLVSATDPAPPDRGFDNVQILPDYRAVIDSGVDAVFVCTPNRFIPDVACAALEAGKHVFCEKPPGRNMGDIERIMQTEQRHPDQVLKIGFNHRYHYGIIEAKKLIDSGTYGRIMWMRGTYGKGQGSGNPDEWRDDPELAGGGILFDQGIHMLDLFRHFAGEFSEIKSMCATFSNCPMEDNAFALLRNEGGIIAQLHSSYTQWKHRFTLEIFCEDGYVIVDGMPSSTRSYRDEWIIKGRRHTGFAIGNPPEERTFCNTDPSWEMELAEFVECINTGRALRNGTSRDAYETMRLVFGIYAADTRFRHEHFGQPRMATA